MPAVAMANPVAMGNPVAMANPGAMANDAAADDHQQAVAALADVRAALAELVQADASYSTDRTVYQRASQRAINALAGSAGEGYVADPGTPGDTAGAIGHVDALLNRAGSPVWAALLHGAEANMRAAVVHLGDAIKARELMDYERAASRAITYLEVAQGRPTEIGVFGGLEGALANTVLGVPSDARQQDGCAAPSGSEAAYGTHDGYVAWITVPTSDGPHMLAENPGGTSVSVQNGMIVLNTAAAASVAKACGKHAQANPADPPPSGPAGAAQQTAMPVSTKPAASPAGPLPTLYTKTQAEAGSQIFAAKCVACHGTNLQGTAAPSVAGNDFLQTAQHNGWTLEIIRYIVFKMMPRNAPATLSPTEDAKLMAFLLASNCYPAGSKPFPSSDDPAFGKITLGPVPGHPPQQNDKGVCKVS